MIQFETTIDLLSFVCSTHWKPPAFFIYLRLVKQKLHICLFAFDKNKISSYFRRKKLPKFALKHFTLDSKVFET